jgi:protein-tyrosine phosphatase
MKRLIDLEGCLNFRDLGGYPTADGRRVRWRRVFRSDALHLLTAADVERLQDELRLREVVDLRSSAERRADPRRPLEEISPPIRAHHAPLFDGEASSSSPGADDRRAEIEMRTLADRYVALAEYAKPAIARVVTLIADSEGPCVYHCAAGKDRTGVISAVLLGVLGVREDLIVADYAATQENLDAIVDRLLSTAGYQTMLSALPPDTMHAEPDTMIEMLARLRERYGSLRDYALDAGVPASSLAQLADCLLEE